MAITVNSFICERCLANGTIDNTGTYLKAIINFVSDKTATYSLKYQVVGATSWITLATWSGSSVNRTYVSTSAILNAETTYYTYLEITNGTDTSGYMDYIPKTFVLLDFNASGKGLAIGKISEKANELEIAMEMYDKYNTLFCNGRAYYEAGSAIDADTCTEELFLTTISGLGMCFVRQIFYSMKDNGANRVQIAYPYAYDSGGSMTGHLRSNYRRNHVYELGWSDWMEEPVVIETGSSGIWRYKKYSDGTAEMFGKIDVSSVSVSAALGNWYRSDTLYGIYDYTYPIYFTEAPTVELMFQTTNSNGGLLWVFSASTSNARYYLPQCYIIRPTTASGINGYINVIVKGKV